MTAVTRSQVRRAADRDLRMSAHAETPKTKKKKVATAMVGAGTIQKRKKPAKASSQGRAAVPKAAAGKKKKLAEASSILKLKKEAYGAQYLWEHRHDPVGAVERWVKAKAEEAQPNKTKMVVKTRLPREFIDVLKGQQPVLLRDYPDDDEPDEFVRHLHAMVKYMNSKMYAYHQALIDQYISQGYADDEDEVTTDGEQEN